VFIELTAVSCDSRCADILFGAGFAGAVHSIFASTLNIVGRDGVLYSIVWDTADDAPNSVRVRTLSAFGFNRAGLAAGAPVKSEGARLLVGDALLVVSAGMNKWDEPLPPFPGGERIADLKANLAVLRAVVAAAGNNGGATPANNLFAAELAERTAALLAALGKRDMAAAETLGRRLLGLGIGQTPAGDDFLSGLLLVINMPGAPFGQEYSLFGRYLATEARHLTNDISRAMLSQAAAGRARASLIRLLKALVAGDGYGVAGAAAGVLAIGSTSGTDMAAGIAAGMQLALSRVEEDKGGNYGDKNCH
jgi:hypothetical protein